MNGSLEWTSSGAFDQVSYLEKRRKKTNENEWRYVSFVAISIARVPPTMIQMTICLWVKNYSSSWLCRPWTEWWKRINCILRGLLDYILFPVQFFHNAVRIGVPFPAMLWMSITWSPEYQVVDRLVWCVYHWERQQPVVKTIAEVFCIPSQKKILNQKYLVNNEYVVHLSSSRFINVCYVT